MKKNLHFIAGIILGALIVCVPTSAYIVQDGDTLFKIAEKSNMSLSEVIELNDIDNPELILPGQEILTNQAYNLDLPFFQKLSATSEGLLGGNDINFVQVQNLYLSGSGISSTVSSIGLTDFKYPVNNLNVVMTDFGDIGYAVIEPDSSREENISFSGITQNADGSATITGVVRGLGLSYPYTASTTLASSHSGSSLLRISNTAPFYNEFNIKGKDETITGKWTFNVYPEYKDSVTATTSEQFITKRYADNLVNQGAATSTEVVAGISTLATRLQQASSTYNGILDPLVLQSRYSSDNTRGFDLMTNQDTGGSDQNATTTTHYFAQTFLTTATTTRITRIGINLKTVNSPTGSVAMRLMTVDSSGNPDTVIGTYTSRSVTDITASYVMYNYDDINVKVSPNTTYAISFWKSVTSETDYVHVEYSDTASVYADGNYLVSYDSGSNWTASTTLDFVFKIYGNEPATSNTTVVSDSSGYIDWSWFDLTRNVKPTGIWDFTGNTTFSGNTSGIVSDLFTAGETLTGGTTPVPVYASTTQSNKVYIVAPNTTSTRKIIGMAVENVSADESVLVQSSGILSGFSALEVGEDYYVQTDSSLATTTPANNILIRAGKAIASDKMLLDFNIKYKGYVISSITDPADVSITQDIGFRPTSVSLSTIITTDACGSGSSGSGTFMNNGLYHAFGSPGDGDYMTSCLTGAGCTLYNTGGATLTKYVQANNFVSNGFDIRAYSSGSATGGCYAADIETTADYIAELEY